MINNSFDSMNYWQKWDETSKQNFKQTKRKIEYICELLKIKNLTFASTYKENKRIYFYFQMCQ